MRLFALGINHNYAEVAQREQLARWFCEGTETVQNLLEEQAISEAVVLTTCNRTEIYTVTQCHHAVKAWIRRQFSSQQAPLVNKMYEHHDLNMIKHVMSVASGLDSMILGEPQILGQVKQSYQSAVRTGTVGPQFKHLFPAVFEVAKMVRTQTGVGANPVSLTSAVMQLAKQFFSDLSSAKVLLIGAGETIELMANYFAAQKVDQIFIANRTLEHAHNLARRYHCMPIRFEEMNDVLPQVDLIVSATASPEPILKKAMFTQSLENCKPRSLFIADLAVPRDVAEDVMELPNVHLYNLDHLQKLLDTNRHSRLKAAESAQALIDAQANHYLRQLRVIDAGDMIRNFRYKMEAWRDQELVKALKRIEKSTDPRIVLQDFARNLTNKFMHEPTKKLRDAAYAEHEALMSLLKELYEL